MITAIDKLTSKCKVLKKKHAYGLNELIEELAKLRTISIGSRIDGLCLVGDGEQRQVVVRTQDGKSPIKVYDYSGNPLSAFGAGIDGLIGGSTRDISFDTTRGLYLATCADRLVRVDKTGEEYDSIPLEGNLHGIAYIQREDIYVVCARATRCLLIINPNSKAVMRKVNIQGLRDPTYVNSRREMETSTMVVTDHDGNTLYTSDTRGHLVQSYGSADSREGNILKPRGVYVSPGNRIVICDYGNRRLTSLWKEDGQARWKCLLSKPQLAHAPRCVDIDMEKRLLFIGTDNNEMIIFTFV